MLVAMLATAAMMQTATAPSTSPVASPHSAPSTAWLSVSTEHVDADQIASRYLELRLRQESAFTPRITQSQMREHIAQHDFVPVALADIAGADGVIERWSFDEPTTGSWPTRATVWRNAPGDAYGMVARVLCSDTPATCDAYRATVVATPAPRPIVTGDTGNDARYRGWLEVVARESCTPHARSMPAPPYPPSALRQEAHGRVVLQIHTNPCGRVREAVVYESSGNRDIDRSAVDTARRWWVSMPEGAQQGIAARVPFTFAQD
ncbi:energy transducer TonB [Lysobacter claricitrinus]|uniref:energy transducer TonB n=1 Tax=Lysobacter claricitrinus TaxID=3367728 RepID=UPI0037DB76AD